MLEILACLRAGTRQIDVWATIEYRSPLISWRNAPNNKQRCRWG